MITSKTSYKKLDAVVLTTSKDTRAFLKSIESGLKHLVDVDIFYVITPNSEDLAKQVSHLLSPRIVIVDESIFPFRHDNISSIMFETVKERGIYPMNGNSHFEKTVYGKVGWFLQQLLKMYAGKICKLNDFVWLDSDIIWFKDVKFIANDTESVPVSSSKRYDGSKYYYATSSQYHPAYLATLPRISGISLLSDQPVHRSGICHHMVVVKSVMDELFRLAEEIHGRPMWQILLNVR
jgi:hypothetical protein